jgi:hypothetical protein
MGKMITAIDLAEEKFKSLKVNKLTGALILRNNKKEQLNAVTASFDGGEHVEAELMSSFDTLQGMQPIENVYLYVFYTPCTMCHRLLYAYPARYPKIKWKLAYMKMYLTGMGEHTYADADACSNSLEILIRCGWKVRAWGAETGEFRKLSADFLFGKKHSEKHRGELKEAALNKWKQEEEGEIVKVSID